jgi:serine/threonine protein kinase
MTQHATEQRPLAVGSSIAGLRIERIVRQRPGRPVRAEAVAADGTRVALKLVAAGLGKSDRSQRIMALARLRAEIKHGSLLPVRAGCDSGWLFVATPTTAGRTLAERLGRVPLPAEYAIVLLEQVAAGLDVAAACGLIHRELEPSNIVLTNGKVQRAMLTDFGVFVPDGAGCTVEAAIAAAAYTPPEVVRGQPRLPQSNVYSLACVFAECLSRVRPFERGRPLLTFHAQLFEPPPRLSELKPGLPSALDEVVATALAKDPAERFETASVFVHEARLALAREAQALRPAPAPAPREPESKPDPKARRERGRRRRIRAGFGRLRTVPVVAASLLVIAVSSGFALGSAHHGGGKQASDHTRPTAQSASARNAQAVQTVNAAMGRLLARRDAVLQVLQRARRSTTQATGAALLAEAYRSAASELPTRSGLDLRHVATSLNATADAYIRLASAAEARDPSRYDKVRRAISANELQLQNAVKALAIAPSGSGYGSVKGRRPGWQPHSSSLPRS